MKISVTELNGSSFNEKTREVMTRLLESDMAGSILLPKKTTGGDNYVQALVKSPRFFSDTDVSVPVMPVQSARLISNLTFSEPGEKIAVVVKPCEARAVVELTKYKQVRRESLLIIAVDCLGTYEPTVFSGLAKKGNDPAADLRKQAANGRCEPAQDSSFRTACTMCEYPSMPLELVDMVIGLWGIDCEKQLYIEAGDETAARLIECGALDFQDAGQPETGEPGDATHTNGAAEPADQAGAVNTARVEEIRAIREKALAALRKERISARDRILEDFRGEAGSLQDLQKLFSICMRCHNCMINCPICYCRECVFRSPAFEHTPDQYLGWAEDKGAIRMPENTVMFHLTRLNHMVMSCVGCGLCDTACPNDIPVASLFRTVGLRAQGMMEYEPGRSYDEPAPATTFRDDELLDESGTA